MKKLLFAISIALMATTAKAQCFYIQSILADACNTNGCPSGATEGQNEMATFVIGAAPLNVANLSINWPSNPFLGIETNTTITTPLVNSLNSTIISCGYLKQPTGGVLPAHATVLVVTSTDMCTTGNSFANLTDTLYIIFQKAGNTAGHFLNYQAASAIRSLTMSFSTPASCSSTVSYDASLLTNTSGGHGGTTTQKDGGAIEYNSAGVANYVNRGCQAPYIPITITATTSASACSNATPAITAVVSGPAVSYSWTTTGTGSLSVSTGTLSGAGSTTLNPAYTPGTGETGNVTFTITAQGKCALISATVSQTVSIFINPPASPTVTSSNGAAICNGSSTLLTASNSGTLTTTYAWNPGGATTSTLSVSPPTGTQIYTLTATTSCGSKNVTFTITTNPLPNIIVANDSVCIGGSATLTATGADTYTWSTGTNSSTISASNVTSNTNYTVTGTNTLTTCQNTAVGHIIVRTPPTIITNSTSICEGVESTLVASGGATNSYTWSPGGPSGSNTYSVTPNNTTPIIVTGADVHGCVNTNTVTINDEPIFTIANGGICPGASATLTPIPSTGATATYSWIPLGVTTTDAAPSVAVQPGATTTYTVISTNLSGCSYTQTVSVAVNSTLTITPPTNTLVCVGVTNTLTVSGASTYNWTASVGGVVPVTVGDFSSVLVNQTGNVTYTVSGSSGSCSTSIIFTIGVAPLFTVTATATPSASVCPNNTVTLTANATPSSTYTYTWSGGVIDGTAFTPASSQQYTVTGTDANGCKATATENISVFATPTLSVNSPSVCPAATATLTASGAQTYTWSATTGGGSVGTTTTIPTVNPQTYTVIGTDVNNCVSTVSTITVTTFATPTITAVSLPNDSVCAGSSVTLTGNGGVSYIWTGGITNGTAFTPASSQVYTVTGTDGNSCKGTATRSVTVNPLPVVTATSETICVGNSATLQAGGATTYTWSTLAQTQNITVQPTTTTNYTVVGTDGFGCSNFAVATVLVNNLPVINVASNSNNNTVCVGTSATLTASGTATTYDWDNAGTNANPIVVSPTTSTTYTVVGSDANSCSNTNTITINTSSQPTMQTITGNTVVCRGYQASPTTLSVPNGSVGYWAAQSLPTTAISTTSSVNITKGGVYIFISVNGCGQAISTFTVAADSVVANFNANPTMGQMPVTVSYTNTSVSLSGNNLGYVWEFGNNAAITAQINPTETFTAAGIYQTTLTATDNNGCKDTATVYIVVKDVPEVVVIPNIFSPNGDNINEQFYITATGITNLECKIYDRWGLLLYSWTGLDGYWDGKAKSGSNCTEGTYFYVVTYTDNQSKSVIKNSFFQLVR